MKKISKSLTARDVKAFHAKAQELVDSIAANRDKLRDLIEEYHDIVNSVGDAKEELEHALEKISELL